MEAGISFCKLTQVRILSGQGIEQTLPGMALLGLKARFRSTKRIDYNNARRIHQYSLESGTACLSNRYVCYPRLHAAKQMVIYPPLG